jgi:hypothetical protein
MVRSDRGRALMCELEAGSTSKPGWSMTCRLMAQNRDGLVARAMSSLTPFAGAPCSRIHGQITASGDSFGLPFPG